MKVMESSEKRKSELPDGTMADIEVDHGTISTAEPVPGGLNHKDGSVVSAVTDPASLEGNALNHADPRQPNLEVPEQVIVADSDSNPEQLAPDSEIRNVSPTEPPIHQFPEDSSAVTTSAIPAARAALNDETERNSSTGDTVASAPADPNLGSHNDDGIDDYIRSPEVQNAIVERSPGGRYVRFMEKLGSGASKDVYRAYDTQEGIEVAWNVVNLLGVPKNERNRIVNEVRLLERLHHHNIISFHGSWVNRERQEVNFVTEILSSGTLKSFINKVQVIRWKIAKRWAVQILNGLEYLHSQDPPVIHRDLKCDNIFINGTSGDLRIGDLGLSTVHQNGRVLSVLGTPEFMAPDMYEEKPYDEKVDIYAFGMCMLEIFTKEIPYSECNNPAQIYKRVSSGELPEVLKRLESKHARDFVELCLGYRNEEGSYVRPAASELLKHPFLVKRASDDDEVMVDPPLRERAIAEVPEASSPAVTPSSKRSIARQESTQESKAEDLRPRGRELSRSSFDEEDEDRFEAMPESETNMKKVKVLMGRDTELEDEETTSVDNAPSSSQVKSSDEIVEPNKGLAAKYLVAAAVIQNENPSVRPYADDVLKLVITLPVDGQTQNVRFDFHLVEDDAIQVAREMVADLGIPQTAVLEVSETISGLACAARMKQDKYAVRMQNQSQSGQLQSQTHSASQPQQPASSQSLGSVGIQNQDPSQVPPTAQPPVQTVAPSISQNVPRHQLPPNEQNHQQVQQSQPHHQQQQPFYPQQPSYSVAPVPGDHSQSHQQAASTQPHLHHQATNPQVHQPNTNQPQYPLHMQQQTAPHLVQQSALQSNARSSSSLSQIAQPGMENQPQQAASQQNLAPAQAEGQPQHGYIQSGEMSHGSQSIPQGSETPVDNAVPVAVSQARPIPPPQVLQQNAAVQSSHSTGGTPVVSHDQQGTNKQSSHGRNGSSVIGSHEARSDASTGAQPPQPSQAHEVQGLNTSMGSVASASDGLESGLDDEVDDEELAGEIRKLDEDFQKNMQRAKKVFDSRMDNLQRSQIEREAQHQKFLEKHEKERADFEKRLAQEADHQAKRIQQLRLEWDRRRENLAQNTQKKSAPPRRASGNAKANGISQAADLPPQPPTDVQDSSQNTSDGRSPSVSVSPVVSERKFDSSEAER